jgi:L-aspartate oxidase
LVFAKRIARRIPEEPADRGPVRVPREDRSPCGEDLQGIMDLIRRIMTRHAFVIRTRRGLQEALDQVGGIMRHLEGLELRSTEAFEAFNMAQVARAVLSAALSRPGSLGSHWIEG